MDDDTIYISPENIEIVDIEEYSRDITEKFPNIPEVAKPLLKNSKVTFRKIEEMLYSAPALINALKATVPKETFQAILTNNQKRGIAAGTLKLMTKKDWTLIASLINNKTKKIVNTIPLKSVKITPEMTQAMTSYATQMQMVQLAEQIQEVQLAVEEVRQGQEYDRLATGYSCQQKLLQAMEIKNKELQSTALLRIAADAEDSRNLLILSQKSNVNFIKEQPETFFKKIMSGATPDKINLRMKEIRESLCVVTMVSFVEAMAYQEMGELEAAKKSLQYYAGFVKDTYLSSEGLLERLDLIDPSPKKYWAKILPEIEKRIESLPYYDESILIGDNKDEREKM